MRVLVTRPEPGASATAERLRSLGHEPVILPLSRILLARPKPIASGVGFAGAIATSANAVRHLPVALHRRFAELAFHVVGERTADVARKAGLHVEAVARDVDDLAAMLAGTYGRGDRLAYVCGLVRRPELEIRLTGLGIGVTAVETYDTIQISHATDSVAKRLDERPVDAIFVYSGIGARQLRTILEIEEISIYFEKSIIYCISERVANALAGLGGHRIEVAAQPDEAGLLALLVKDR